MCARNMCRKQRAHLCESSLWEPSSKFFSILLLAAFLCRGSFAVQVSRDLVPQDPESQRAPSSEIHAATDDHGPMPAHGSKHDISIWLTQGRWRIEMIRSIASCPTLAYVTPGCKNTCLTLLRTAQQLELDLTHQQQLGTSELARSTPAGRLHRIHVNTA